MLIKPAYCDSCSLAGNMQGFTVASGSGRTPLCVISEAPGEHEEDQGRPLVEWAPAGSVFQRVLDELRINRNDLTLTNILRCLDGGTQVYLPDGSRRRIAELVNANYRGNVLSFDGQKFVPRKVIAVHKSARAKRKLFKVSYVGAKSNSRGTVGAVATEDHEFLTEGGRWVRADKLHGERINIGPQALGKRSYQTALGTLLGDGGMRTAAILRWSHAEAQREWSETKARVFGAHTTAPKPRKDKKGSPYVTAHTKANRTLAELKREFYPQSKKRVPKWIRTELHPQGLATWFLDDGYLRIRAGKRRPLAEIATCAFSESDLAILLDALWVNGLQAHVNRGRIYFDVHNTELLVQIISRFVPPTMRYKLGTSKWLSDFDSQVWEFEPLEAGFASAIVKEQRATNAHKVFCLTVEGTNNFVTPVGVVHNCRPNNNELRGAPYEWSAINHCKKYLNETIAETRPKCILALGAIPLRELLDPDCGVPADLMSIRGFLLRSKYPGIHLVSSYHPAHLVRGSMHLMSAVLPDVRFAYRVATVGAPTPIETHYELHPTLDDVRRFYHHLAADQSRPVAVDVETIELLGKRDEADWRRKTLIQIQFSDGPGRAIVLPWQGRFIDAAKAILALNNPKWTWNGRLADLLVLRGSGCIVNGDHHDLMNAMVHLQPSFTAGRDDKFGDKGIVTKLLGLQSAASFYCPEFGPWKHLAWDRSMLQVYGAIDADITFRVGIGIFQSLREAGLYKGYETFKRSLCEVLDDLGAVGLPIDRELQADLRAYTIAELKSLQDALQPLVPTELRSVHPPEGWKGIPRSLCVSDEQLVKVADLVAAYDEANPPYVVMGDPAKSIKGKRAEGHLVQLTIPYKDASGVRRIIPGAPVREPRWCLLKPFNPGSPGESGQVGRYLTFMGYPMPRKIDDPSKGTTGKAELERLAEKVNDPVLNKIVEYRQLRKTGMDYTTGAWTPGEDGRVHTTMRPNTASGQTTSSNPNIQQFPEHSGLAKRAKAMVRAEPGHKLVKVDMRGFHSRAIGHLANDPIYYKMADFDVHSFITAHFLGLHDAPYLMDMDDAELRVALAAIKAEHEHTRNFKVKRCVHGRQFNMGLPKLYRMHQDNFDPKPAAVIAEVGELKWYSWNQERQQREISRRGRAEASHLYNLFDELFPKTFKDFPLLIEAQIQGESRCELKTPYGTHRYFWDFDKEQSTAFLPSNSAHCEIQLALIRLRKLGALAKFEVVNFTHDALWLHPRTELVDECIALVQEEFERPSEVLISPVLGPFQCNSDAEVGESLVSMKAYRK